MKKMYGLVCLLVIFSFQVISIGTARADSSKTDKKISEIDKNEKESLDKLFKEQPKAKALLQKSHGYAVFHSSQTALMVSGGSGTGVAIDNKTKKRTYMRMASGGVGVGVGVQMMDVIFIFETSDKFDNFVNKGWDADASASAATADKGVNSGASYINGVAVYQMTDKGLIAQASLKGTKYWTDDKLNGKK